MSYWSNVFSPRPTFATEHEAHAAGKDFLDRYRPEGYGSWYKVAETPDGRYQLTTWKADSCD